MRHFHYKAFTADGTTIEASCEAESRAGALTLLKAQGLFAQQLSEVSRKSNHQLPKVSRSVISRFYGMLGDQLQVGVPLLAALELIGRQEQSSEARRLVNTIANRVESGDSLSQALEPYEDIFSEVDLNLIRAGEEGGFLPDALERIAQMREWQHRLTANVYGAAAYPLLLVAVAMMLVPAVLIYLVPKLEPIFESLRRDAALPWATSLLLKISSVCQNYGFLVVVSAVAILLATYCLVPSAIVRDLRDKTVLRLPFFGVLVREFVLARFCRVLGTLLQNKIQMLTALEISTKVMGNKHLANAFGSAQESIASGRMLAEALERTHQIPADSLAMIGVAEQSNTLDVVLIKVATQLETRTNRRLEIAVKLIEPLLLLVLAVFVGFVVLALLLPIFEGQSLG
jgi:general secretion pathway protein F/type IV pilus assembly protein PilC